MNADIFAEFLRRQGYKVLESPTGYWVDLYGTHVFQAFPYARLVSSSYQELAGIFRQGFVAAVRFFSPDDAEGGAESFHVVCDAKDYDLHTLSHWARKNVKRGLRNCDVRRIDFEHLAVEGFYLQVDTLERQKRKLQITSEWWRSLCLAAKDLPGFDAWGAFVGDELAASVITFQDEDWGYMLYQQCLAKHLEAHANNALAFVVTRELMQREKIRQVLYSVKSLDAPPSVHEFQCRMGYYRKRVREYVVFNPLFAPFVNKLSYRLIHLITRQWPEQGFWSKVDGLVRVALREKDERYA
jgi:hypothetical protein